MSKGRKVFSGDQVISLLTRKFGFERISQKGSHVKMRGEARGRTMVTIVPLHKELAVGTLHGVLELAGIAKKEFLAAARKKR